MPESNASRLRTAGIKQLIVTYVMLLVQIMVFFVSAGHIDLRPWIFFLAFFLHYSASTVVQYKLNPGLLVHRLKRTREGSKMWDEILMRVSNLTVLILLTAVAGLDVGSFHWSELDVYYLRAGFVLFIGSTVLLNWAMIVNPYFEPAVRIQKDRGHRVITSGPYRIVRHPGYLAGILYALSIPLIVGSAFTFIPVGIYILLLAVRTLLEDRTLYEELNGYSEYAETANTGCYPDNHPSVALRNSQSQRCAGSCQYGSYTTQV